MLFACFYSFCDVSGKATIWTLLSNRVYRKKILIEKRAMVKLMMSLEFFQPFIGWIYVVQIHLTLQAPKNKHHASVQIDMSCLPNRYYLAFMKTVVSILVLSLPMWFDYQTQGPKIRAMHRNKCRNNWKKNSCRHLCELQLYWSHSFLNRSGLKYQQFLSHFCQHIFYLQTMFLVSI